MTDNPKEVEPLIAGVDASVITSDINAPSSSLQYNGQQSPPDANVGIDVSNDGSNQQGNGNVQTTYRNDNAVPNVTVLPVSLHKSEGVLLDNQARQSSPLSSPILSDPGNSGLSTPGTKVKVGHRRSQSDTLSKSDVTVLLNGEVVLTNGSPSGGGLNAHSKKSSLISSQGGLRHRICIEEVVPSTSSYLGDFKEQEDSPDWRSDLVNFTSKRHANNSGDSSKKLTRSVRRYYKTQDELITAFENLHLDLDDAMENAEEQKSTKRRADILAKVSFFCNLLLLIAKSVAAGMSGSLAVISSVIDSAVDLASGALMWWSSRAVKNRNIYEYPQGRTKLEPVAIVILAVIMSLASVQMIRESIEKIIYYAKENGAGPSFGVPTIVICSATVVIKFVLWLVCRRVKTPGVQALSQDHRNDVLSNSIAIACGLIGDRLWSFADPIGAILISLYIIVSWFLTGWEQIKMLTGVTARPDFLKKITWIAVNHHSSVLLIDTVRAFHFGSNFLVEVDIVLPEEMSLKQSHDIGESLQLKIERLPEVERAFVHLDYETEHSPFSEHKQV